MSRFSVLIRFLALGCLCLFLLSTHKYYKPFNSDDQLFIGEQLIIQLFTILIMPLVPGALLALIPFKNSKYKTRIINAYAISLIVFCLLMIWSYYRTGPRYDAVPAIHSKDCKSLRVGKFKTNKLLISRDSVEQIETIIETGEEFHSSITWISDCEYVVGNIGDLAKIKILKVDDKGYECIVWRDGKTSAHIRVDKVEN